jgi:hypothetical protein
MKYFTAYTTFSTSPNPSAEMLLTGTHTNKQQFHPIKAGGIFMDTVHLQISNMIRVSSVLIFRPQRDAKFNESFTTTPLKSVP